MDRWERGWAGAETQLGRIEAVSRVGQVTGSKTFRILEAVRPQGYCLHVRMKEERDAKALVSL